MSPEEVELDKQWRREAEKVADLALKVETPLVFLLGAGCSLTSGGPTDRQVQDAIKGLPNRQREGEALGQHVDPTAQAHALKSLFSDISPNIGYHCLVGLARRRSVYVLNLNFDSAVQNAADIQGVRCDSWDVRETEVIEEALAESESSCRIINAHLHGKAQNARFTREQKAEIGDAEKHTIRQAVKSATVVILGTSLRNAEDIRALLKDAEIGTAHYFSRTDELMDESDKQVRAAEFPVIAPNAHWIASDLDFDAFMLHLAGAFHGYAYDEFSRAGGRSHLGLPALDDTAFPSTVLRKAMRAIFENGVAVISGPPHVGKSVAGNIVSYCLALVTEAGTTAGSPCYSGEAEAYEALADGTDVADVSSVLLLKPMDGEADDFFPRLLSRPTAGFKQTRVVVCCDDADLPGATVAESLAGVLATTDEWYSYETLDWIGRRREFDRQVLDSLREHSLSNPGTFLLGLDPYGKGNGEARFVAHYSALLSRNREAALDCCLLRMAELTRTDVPLYKVSGGVPEDADRRRLLIFFEFENRPCAALANESVRRAVDGYLSAEATGIAMELSKRVAPWSTAREIWGRWALLQGTSLAEAASSEGQDPGGGVEFFPLVLSSRPKLDTLENQIASATDAWDVGELCYEIVKNWPKLQGQEAREAVANLVADPAKRGLYGMLEAVLYFGSATHCELRSLVQDRLWERLRASDISDEIWLCADALFWRSPTDGLRWTADWLGSLESADAEAFEALWIFEAAYHPDGCGVIEQELKGKRSDQVSDAGAKLMAWLVRWHFLHQSYSRARIGSVSRRLDEKAFLCRSFYPRGQVDPEPIIKLVHALGRITGTAGWGFHAGCRSLREGRQDGLKAAMGNALGRAEKQDAGVVSAVAAYPLAAQFRTTLSEYFTDDANRAFLLDCLGEGVFVDGVQVRDPRFEMSSDPGRVLSVCGLEFRQLRKRGIYFSDWSKFETKVGGATNKLLDERQVEVRDLRAVLPKALGGDLRILEETMPARARDTDADDPLAHAIQMACLKRRGQTELPFN